MKRTGPDSLESWIIACVCSFNTMIIMGLLRLSGILFVASISRFQVSRDKASLPFTLAFVMRYSLGPLIGYLSHKFGVKFVTTAGCILTAVGAGASFFAENIDIVTVFWGIVFGFGSGLGNMALPVSINVYFDKHRATALGILQAGGSLGSFVLVPIVEILLDNYGLSGTFLLLSGIALNCVPAALLLKKPNFDIKKRSKELRDQLFTVEDGFKRPLHNLKVMENINIPSSSYKENKQNARLSSGEKIKLVSGKTTLSENPRFMGTSEPFNLNHILENWKVRILVGPNILDSEITSLSFQNRNTDLNLREDKNFEKNILSSSVGYENPIFSGTFDKLNTLTPEDANSFKMNELKRNILTGYPNLRYKNSVNDFKHMDITDQFLSAAENDYGRQRRSLSIDSSDIILAFYQNYMYSHKYQSSDKIKSILKYRNTSKHEWPERENFKMSHNEIVPFSDKSNSKPEKISALETFCVFLDPVFNIILITNAIYVFSFVAMSTIIVDFARDLNIGVYNEQYVLMTLSLSGIIGRVGLGWITDYGFMTVANYTAFCFAFQGVLTAVLVVSNGFITLMILVTVYGMVEAGIVVIIPVLIAQYIDPDKQTVAIPCRSVIAGPLILAAAPLIGFFRDTLGAYDFFLFGNGLALLLCSFSWLLVPFIAR